MSEIQRQIDLIRKRMRNREEANKRDARMLAELQADHAREIAATVGRLVGQHEQR